MAFFIKILSVILEYGMLLCLILFVVKSVGYLFGDLRKKSREIRNSNITRNPKLPQNFD